MRTRKFLVTSAALALIAAILSSCSGVRGATTERSVFDPPQQVGRSTPGGAVVVGNLQSVGPRWILPILPQQQSNLSQLYLFTNLMWRPLYWRFVGTSADIDYKESIASEPVYSPDKKTVTIKMNTNYTWSDGTPVTADDVVFYVDLVKAAVAQSPANFAGYSPGTFPENIASIKATASDTVTMILDQPWNPTWFTQNQLTNIVPLPSKVWNRTAEKTGLDYTNPATATLIYEYLAGQAKSLATYSQNPLWKTVDGPYALDSYEPSTTQAVLTANPKYTGPGKPNITKYTLKPFTSNSAMLTALKTGAVDVAPVPLESVQQISQLQQENNVYAAAPPTTFYISFFNYKSTTNHFDAVIKQPYIRQALAHLQDVNAEVKGIYDNFAVPEYGPLPSTNKSQYAYAGSATNPYPYDVAKAKSLLTEHGWNVVPKGVTACANPGSGPGQCGPGIPAGTPLKWTFYHSNNDATKVQVAQMFADAAAQVGISVDLKGNQPGFLIQNFNNVTQPANVDKWQMLALGGTWGGQAYPTTGPMFVTGGTLNYGSYANPEFDRLVQSSLTSSSPDAVKNEMSYLATNAVAQWLPAPMRIIAWRNGLSGPPQSLTSYINGVVQPQYWYWVK